MIKILSFDPGLSTAGWAMSNYDIKTGKLYIKKCGIITATQIAEHKEYREEVKIFSKRLVTMFVARKAVDELIAEFNPDYVCCEDTFFNRFRPSAFMALLQWITTIELHLRDKYRLPLFKLAPKTIKHSVSTGTANKKDVENGVLLNRKMIFDFDNKSDLIEHEWDACACAWAFSLTILPELIAIKKATNAK